MPVPSSPAPGFSDRLAAAVERAGITQKVIYETGSVSRMTLYNWLSGRSVPDDYEQVARVAAVIGEPVEALWGDTPLSAGERARLMQLEVVVARMRRLLAGLDGVGYGEYVDDPPPEEEGMSGGGARERA